MRILVMLLLFLTLPSLPALAQSGSNTEKKEAPKRYLYQWTDSKGVVHITDDLGDVPERYRSKANKIEAGKPQEPGGEQRAGERPTPGFDSGNTAAEEASKARWQQRLRDWKDRLAKAEQQYQDLDQQRTQLLGSRGSAAYAPIADRLKAEQIGQQLKDVQREIDNARNMIENVIPEEARKAGVPPGWLRE